MERASTLDTYFAEYLAAASAFQAVFEAGRSHIPSQPPHAGAIGDAERASLAHLREVLDQLGRLLPAAP